MSEETNDPADQNKKVTPLKSGVQSGAAAPTEVPDDPMASQAVQLALTIRDKAVLYATYMPFIKNGAIFVPTTRDYQLGDPISMVLRLLEEPQEITVEGQVIWITPNGAQGNRSPGIGVQFAGENGIHLRNKIETILAGALKADRPTHTM